jgi:hypothetical protein
MSLLLLCALQDLNSTMNKELFLVLASLAAHTLYLVLHTIHIFSYSNNGVGLRALGAYVLLLY